MNKVYFLFLLIALPFWGNSQSVPVPGKAQSKPILLENGVIHVGNGEVIEKGGVLIVDGKIAQAGVIRGRQGDVEAIDLAGQHVYPGLIAPVTQIGLDEIEAVRATDDRSEVGQINPNVRAIIGYNTDSRVTPTLRSNGILLAQIAPTGGLFSGTSTVVQLDAWNWEDAAYKLDDAIHLHWPRLSIRNYPGAPPIAKQKEGIQASLKKIDDAMGAAHAYFTARKSGREIDRDLRWEAMLPVFEQAIPLFIYANSEKQIRSALAFKIRYQIKMVLVGGADSWLLAPELKKYEVPVVLRKPHSLPVGTDSDIDQPFKTPKMLQDAGVLFCLSVADFWDQRNLPFNAGTTVAYGLSKEEALQSISLNTAKILGIDSICGSLEAGKDANILVSQGDILDMRSSQVSRAWIQGRELDLGNKQKALYEKYKAKYKRD